MELYFFSNSTLIPAVILDSDFNFSIYGQNPILWLAFSHGSNDLFRGFDKTLHVSCMQNISYFLCFVCNKGHRKDLQAG